MFLSPYHTTDHLTHCQRFCLHFGIGADSAPNTYRGSSRLKRDCKGNPLRPRNSICYPRTVLIKGRVDRYGHQLVPGSGEGQNTRNKSIVGAEADRQSKQMATGPVRHSVSHALFAQGCSCPLTRRRFVLVPVGVPVSDFTMLGGGLA